MNDSTSGAPKPGPAKRTRTTKPAATTGAPAATGVPEPVVTPAPDPTSTPDPTVDLIPPWLNAPEPTTPTVPPVVRTPRVRTADVPPATVEPETDEPTGLLSMFIFIFVAVGLAVLVSSLWPTLVTTILAAVAAGFGAYILHGLWLHARIKRAENKKAKWQEKEAERRAAELMGAPVTTDARLSRRENKLEHYMTAAGFAILGVLVGLPVAISINAWIVTNTTSDTLGNRGPLYIVVLISVLLLGAIIGFLLGDWIGRRVFRTPKGA